MAGIEGKHQARKPSKASQLNEVYSRPMKNGTGLQPRFINGEYRGERLHPDVQRRIDEYAAIKSYMPPSRTWIVVVGESSTKMCAAVDTAQLQDIARMMR